MKLLILIPSHSCPVYTKLTVSSLIRSLPNYELNIHIGIHSNYSDYTKDLSLFNELIGIAQMHLVDEIDWMAEYDNILRYSKMHCLNLLNLLKNCKYYDFDYAIHLDNDLFIKGDFLTSLIEDKPDFIFDYFENTNSIRIIESENDGRLQFAPKVTAWNLIFSRKVFDRILMNPNIFFPEKIEDVETISWYQNFLPELEDRTTLIFDTFSKLNFYCNYVWKDIKVKPSNGYLSNMIKHFFFSSFNYGVSVCNNINGEKLVEDIWKKEFPGGIKDLKNKINNE